MLLKLQGLFTEMFSGRKATTWPSACVSDSFAVHVPSRSHKTTFFDKGGTTSAKVYQDSVLDVKLLSNTLFLNI